MKYEIIYTEHYALIVGDEEISYKDYAIHLADNFILKVGAIHQSNGFKTLQDSEGDYQYNHREILAKYCKRVIAYRPLKDVPILEGVPLLPQFSQEDEVEKLADLFLKEEVQVASESTNRAIKLGFNEGYNKAKSTYEFTLEDMRECWNKAFMEGMSLDDEIHDTLFFDNFIQSLKIKRPKYFECEMEQLNNKHGASYATKTLYRSKTITNSQGRLELIGKYIYG